MKRFGAMAAVVIAALWALTSVALAGPYRQEFKAWTVPGSVNCPTNTAQPCSWVIQIEQLKDSAGNPYAPTDYTVEVATDPEMNGDGFVEPGTGWTAAGSVNSSYQITLTLDQYKNYFVRITAQKTGEPKKVHYMRVYPPDKIPHGNYATDTNLCLNCHQTHTGQAPRMLRAQSAAALCLTCHDGSGSKYDVLDGQIKGANETPGTDPESSANAFGRVDTGAGGIRDGASTHVKITSNHTIGVTLTNAPGSGSNYSGDLSCISCHNPHGTSNYRIFKVVNNGFAVNVPAKAVTTDANTGVELTWFFGSYNPGGISGTVGASGNTAEDPNSGIAMVNLGSGASATDNAYKYSFIKIVAGSNTYYGQITEYSGTTKLAKVRVIRKNTDSPMPALGGGESWSIDTSDPKASITTLCQSCHTSFAMARSGAAQSGVSDDGGPGHRYRHAIGIEVYKGRQADPAPGFTNSDYYAIPVNAEFPFERFQFPRTVIPENRSTSATDWNNTTGPGTGKNRVVCISCHFSHGTDRVGFNPVTNPTASVTETVESGTARAVTATTIQLAATADPKFPYNPRGLVVEASGQARTIIGFDEATRTATLDSAWTVSGTPAPTYTVKRVIESMNPNDQGTGKAASTVLKRVNYMGVCQACHQKDNIRD